MSCTVSSESSRGRRLPRSAVSLMLPYIYSPYDFNIFDRQNYLVLIKCVNRCKTINFAFNTKDKDNLTASPRKEHSFCSTRQHSLAAHVGPYVILSSCRPALAAQQNAPILSCMKLQCNIIFTLPQTYLILPSPTSDPLFPLITPLTP
jgi:hypothetical protein